MKKWLLRISVTVLVVGGTAYLFKEQIVDFLIESKFKPAGEFTQEIKPPVPDYTLNSNWAALPNMVDYADHVQDGITADNQATAKVDVFFVHPTTHIRNTSWIAAVDDTQARQITDRFVLKGQASSFNGCCAIYAPLYRQATLYSFIDKSGQGTAALEFAYQDVEKSFAEFIHRTAGRPFVLAGHSQGAQHLFKLMAKQVSGTALMDQLVAAYPVGAEHGADEFANQAPDIPVCQSAGQTACYVTWNARGPDAATMNQLGTACVNPLSWRADQEKVSASHNLGAFGLADLGADHDQIVPKFNSAKCQGSELLVADFSTTMYDNLPINMGKDNYHLLDYALFYQNIKANAQNRVNTYLANELE